MEKPKAFTAIYFNMGSDLPESGAALKYGNIGGNAVSMLNVGDSYNLEFTVESNEIRQTEYTYVIDSRVKNQSESFTLRPGEKKTFKVKLTPSEADKWVFEREENVKKAGTYDLGMDSWLGERLQSDLIVGEVLSTYAYAPISVDVDGYGRILNLNLTLDELKARPYHLDRTSEEITSFQMVQTADYTDLYVRGGKLVFDSRDTSRYFTSKPDLFRLVLVKGVSEGMPAYPKTEAYNTTTYDTNSGNDIAVLSFWYQIK